MEVKLSIAIAVRAWPDVAPVDMSGAISTQHLQQGVVEPLDDFFSEVELADFFEGFLEADTYGHKAKGLP